MSVLSLPRLYFRGEMSWNPSTSNNYPEVYTESDNTANTNGKSENEFTQEVVLGFKNCWNYYGDQSSSLISEETQIIGITNKTQIVGGTLPDGNQANHQDPLIGKPVQILGNIFNDHPTGARLVDVDAYANWTSQIFFKQLVIGNDEIGITGQQERQMCSYWINYGRNYNVSRDLISAGIASAVFQTSIRYDDLEFRNPENSLILTALKNAMEQDDAQGLMIRLCAYRTLYYQNGSRNHIPQQPRNQKDLIDLYQRGEVFDNPAYSLIVGSIGVWNQGELATAPTGRYLKSDQPVVDCAKSNSGTPQSLGSCSCQGESSQSNLKS